MTRLWISITLVLGLAENVIGAQPPSGQPNQPSSKRVAVEQDPFAPLPPRDASAEAIKDQAPEITRVVCPINAPATSIASTINQLFAAEAQMNRRPSVVIVSDAISNSLIIAGPPHAVDDVRKLAEQLDHPAVMVRLEILLVEIPTTGKATVTVALRPDALPDHTEIIASGELTTLENQAASLKMGRRAARITSTSVSAAGRTNSMTFDNMGTSISITPRVGRDRTVFAEVEVEDSRLGPREEGEIIAAPAKGEPVRTPNTESFTARTTIRAADGTTVVIGGLTRQSTASKQRVVLLTPHVLSKN